MMWEMWRKKEDTRQDKTQASNYKHFFSKLYQVGLVDLTDTVFSDDVGWNGGVEMKRWVLHEYLYFFECMQE